MASVDALMRAQGDAVYYDPKWERVLEMHMPLLKVHPTTETVDIPPHLAYKYDGDLWGLLGELNGGYPLWYNWLIMRMNDLSHPAHYQMNRLQLRIPSTQTIDSLLTVHNTIKGNVF